MTFTKPGLFTLPTFDAVLRTARSYFASPDFPDVRPVAPTREAAASPLSPLSDAQTRDERSSEKEVDRHILTIVEQEDTEMLDRVRAALYEA